MPRLIEPLSADERVAMIAAARTHVGIRFRHRGRTENGLDCLGHVVRAFAAIGRTVMDRKVYGRSPEGDNLMQAAAAHFGAPIWVKGQAEVELQPCDISIMQWHQRPQHVALFADYPHGGLSLIHSDSALGFVTEHRYASPWPRRTVAVFRP